MPADQLWFDDLRVGDAWTAPDVTVTSDDFATFGRLTGDAHPMHYDASFAQTNRYGRPVAHGFHLLALTALGATALTEAMRETVIALVRVEARFVQPVFPGDTVSRGVTVTRTAALNPGQGWVELRATLHRGREVAVEADHTYLFKRRP